jgi:hypothetical protein
VTLLLFSPKRSTVFRTSINFSNALESIQTRDGRPYATKLPPADQVKFAGREKITM